MPPLLGSLATRLGFALAMVAMIAVGFAPLFGGPGYESALAAGLVLPWFVSLVTALEVARHRPEPIDALYRGIGFGGIVAFGAYVITVLHGLRVGFCDFWVGSAQFALGPAIGALLAGAWGALAGALASSRQRPWTRRVLATLLALGGPAASMLVSVVRFYTSPMVFAYDPFVGYFSGTLYDTVIDFSGLTTYRAGSAATLLAALVAALHLVRDPVGRLHFQPIGRPVLLVAGVLALAGSIGGMGAGTKLGHWQTPASITEELGAVVAGERCEVVYARALRLADAQRFARDCDAHVIAAEQWLGAQGPPKIRAYLFADAAQKDALMGAADTYIAKPWRKEVYLQHAAYPHPALGHELVHVLAGSFARGPFGVAGRAGGLWPNPGLIEGIAVAASPRDSDLSPREWAKAMKDLGILPQLSRLFAFGFLGENSSTAYTVSGAFVGWIKDKHGAEALRAWYGGRDLPEVVGSSWADLEHAWHADLDRVELPEAARAQARAKFDRPGVFQRRCPHVVDGCKRRGDQLKSSGDIEGMRQQYARVLELDKGDGLSRVTMAAALSRLHRPQEAKRELEVIAADESLTRHVRDRALEELGDLALAAAEPDAAISRYAEVMTRLVEEDPLRTLEVKMGAARDPRARAAVVALLVGDRGRAPDKVRAAELLGAWSAQSTAEGLPDYLLGRHYLGTGDFEEAAARLDQALGRQLPIKRVQVEAERLRIVAACALSDVATAQRLLVSYGVRSDVPTARREAVTALVERCKRAAPPPGR